MGVLLSASLSVMSLSRAWHTKSLVISSGTCTDKLEGLLWHTDIAIYAAYPRSAHLLETVCLQAFLQNPKLLVASLQAVSHLLQKLLSIALHHESLQQFPIHC